MQHVNFQNSYSDLSTNCSLNSSHDILKNLEEVQVYNLPSSRIHFATKAVAGVKRLRLHLLSCNRGREIWSGLSENKGTKRLHRSTCAYPTEYDKTASPFQWA
ncbi:hypothetical protein FKM82_020116 [Ascaphus truei]